MEYVNGKDKASCMLEITFGRRDAGLGLLSFYRPAFLRLSVLPKLSGGGLAWTRSADGPIGRRRAPSRVIAALFLRRG